MLLSRLELNGADDRRLGAIERPPAKDGTRIGCPLSVEPVPIDVMRADVDTRVIPVVRAEIQAEARTMGHVGRPTIHVVRERVVIRAHVDT